MEGSHDDRSEFRFLIPTWSTSHADDYKDLWKGVLQKAIQAFQVKERANECFMMSYLVAKNMLMDHINNDNIGSGLLRCEVDEQGGLMLEVLKRSVEWEICDALLPCVFATDVD